MQICHRFKLKKISLTLELIFIKCYKRSGIAVLDRKSEFSKCSGQNVVGLIQKRKNYVLYIALH